MPPCCVRRCVGRGVRSSDAWGTPGQRQVVSCVATSGLTLTLSSAHTSIDIVATDDRGEGREVGPSALPSIHPSGPDALSFSAGCLSYVKCNALLGFCW